MNWIFFNILQKYSIFLRFLDAFVAHPPVEVQKWVYRKFIFLILQNIFLENILFLNRIGCWI